MIIGISLFGLQHTNMLMQLTLFRNSAKQIVLQLMTLLSGRRFQCCVATYCSETCQQHRQRTAHTCCCFVVKCYKLCVLLNTCKVSCLYETGFCVKYRPVSTSTFCLCAKYSPNPFSNCEVKVCIDTMRKTKLELCNTYLIWADALVLHSQCCARLNSKRKAAFLLI
jgi:hypothetical protein